MRGIHINDCFFDSPYRFHFVSGIVIMLSLPFVSCL